VADFEAKLRWLSERGKPVGAEELIERIEADLAGDPLVVVAKRRKGTLMTKTQEPPRTEQPSRYRGPAWAVAVFVAVLAVAALYVAFSRGEGDVADTTLPPTTVAPTTVAPDVETTADLEVIEAGVAAFYSGDAERAAELFELADRSDDQIRGEAAYQAAIGGRLALSCYERTATPGTFTCYVPYHNAMTDAIGYSDGGDTIDVVVEDGVITEFAFPEHSWMVVEMGTFLASEGRVDGYGDCVFGPFPESCAIIQLENLDAWAAWQEDVEPADIVTSALESWYTGDCQAALFIAGPEGEFPEGMGSFMDCSPSSAASQTIEYESILGAQVSVENCETTSSGGESTLSCEVQYSNAMNSAVGKPAAVTAHEFIVPGVAWVREPGSYLPWYEGDYPEDTELRESFRLFAEATSGTDEWAQTCGSARTPECAAAIVDHLEDWAAWYETNG